MTSEPAHCDRLIREAAGRDEPGDVRAVGGEHHNVLDAVVDGQFHGGLADAGVHHRGTGRGGAQVNSLVGPGVIKIKVPYAEAVEEGSGRLLPVHAGLEPGHRGRDGGR